MKRRSGFKLADRMQSLHELAVARDAIERRATHARHQLHVEHDVGAVGDLDSATRERRIDRPHAIRNDVKRAPLHAAGEQGIHFGMRLLRGKPRIVRSGIFPLSGAHVGDVLDACHVRGIRAIQIASRKALGIERQQLFARHQLAGERLIFGLAPVAPVNLLRLCKPCDFLDPGRDVAIHRCKRRYVLSGGGHRGPRKKLYGRACRMTDGRAPANSSVAVGIVPTGGSVKF